MIVELLNTGSELMLGRVLNTHQQWLGRELADLGYVVSRQVAVPDAANGIQEAVREGLGRADVLLVTGGLGPTSDDMTRDLIAALIQRPLREDPAVLAHISSFFVSRKREMPARTRVQAMVPEGALVLHNAFGTAPGLAIELEPNPFGGGSPAWLIMLPGPPRELRPMFQQHVVPLLRRVFPSNAPFVCRTLRSTGVGESVAEEKISPGLQSLVQAGLQLGYCARPGQVDIRLCAQGAGAATLVKEAEEIVRSALGQSIYSADEEEIEEAVVRLLEHNKQTLAVAESCTGGCVGNRITNVPGASAVFLADVVSYSNAAKETFLGVSSEDLSQHGAVSRQVAAKMAEGVRARTGADYALSLTGIAGPGGGTPQKPVGTVFIGLASESGTIIEHHLNPWDRETFKQVAAQQALELLRRHLTGSPGSAPRLAPQK